MRGKLDEWGNGLAFYTSKINLLAFNRKILTLERENNKNEKEQIKKAIPFTEPPCMFSQRNNPYCDLLQFVKQRYKKIKT
jgi:hypothetical protein